MRKRITALLILSLLAACHSVNPVPLQPHVIQAFPDGSFRHIVTGKQMENPEEYNLELNRLFAGALAYWKKNKEQKVRRLLVHVHGGLNSYSESLATAANSYKEMMDDGIYPIYFTWDSSLRTNYGHHLFRLRYGTSRPVVAALSSPFLIVQDLLSSLANALPSAWSQAWSLGNYGYWEEYEDGYAMLARNHKTYGHLKLGAEPGDRHFGQDLHLYLTPLRIPMQILFTNTVGKGSWDAMRHTAKNLFYRETDIGWSSQVPFGLLATSKKDATENNGPSGGGRPQDMKWPSLEPTGSFATFLKHAAERIGRSDDKDSRPLDIVLVGHSMGAIILNDALDFLAANPAALKNINSNATVSSIVYMAPACTIGSAAGAVSRFMTQSEKTLFYILTLHPASEQAELNFLGASPMGSLLIWIHNYYDPPATPADRVLGMSDHAIDSLVMFGKAKDRVKIKVFGREAGHLPWRHGDFNACPFWREEFWWGEKGHFTVPPDWKTSGWLDKSPNSGRRLDSTKIDGKSEGQPERLGY